MEVDDGDEKKGSDDDNDGRLWNRDRNLNLPPSSTMIDAGSGR